MLLCACCSKSRNSVKWQKSPAFLTNILLGHGIYRLFEGECIRLLQHAINREGVSEQWMTALWPMLQEIAHTVTPDVRDRNDVMDILAYVHIKRLRVATDRSQAQVRDLCRACGIAVPFHCLEGA